LTKIIEANIGNWYVQCIPEDGGRISVLSYEGQDLLTSNPPSFRPPEKFYGAYETRPVFGYDDCFPTVDECTYPADQSECSDHGELCWMEWQVLRECNSLVCIANCPNPKVTFKRILEFAGNKLIWRFEVINLSAIKLPFLHVMHPLLPLGKIQSIKLPEFGNIMEEINAATLGFKTADQVANHLMSIPFGAYEMLLLKEIRKGSVKLAFKKGMILNISFDVKLFPTLGIWWNKTGYPDEDGLRRTECAFEPIPGSCSNLEKSFRKGSFMEIEPGKSLSWEIIWEIENNS